MNQWKLFLVLAFGLLASAPLGAGTSDYTFSLEDESVAIVLDTQVDVEVTVELDCANGDAIDGYSLGVCHDDLVDIGTGDVRNGADVQALNNNAGPGFTGLNFPAGSDAWTCGVIVNLMGMDVLDPADDLEMYLATYTTTGGVGLSAIDFCTAGSPPVGASIVVGKTEFTPDTVSGSIDITEIVCDQFTFSAGAVAPSYCGDDGTVSEPDDTFSVIISAFETDCGGVFPSATAGLSMGVTHDDTLLTLMAANDLPVLSAMNNGAGPGFLGISIAPENGAGFTVGVVYNLQGTVTLEFGVDPGSELFELEYATVPDSFLGDPDGTVRNTEITFTDELGDPTVPNVVVTNGGEDSISPAFVDGAVTLTAECAPPVNPFRRGDPNDDGRNNIADGIWLLSELFRDGPERACFLSGDANGDDKVNQADAVYIFNYQFMGGPQPAAPFTGCDVDGPNQTLEQCLSYSSCN